MGKLQSALDWAARGFPVFPLVEDGKEPAFGGSWLEYATTDVARIHAMWTDPVLGTERSYNIGMDCTDRVVVDIDVKNGKDGLGQYAALGGTYDTLVVRTPSGGFHCYFEGPDSANVGIAADIDIRSHNGFVVAPGSYTSYIEGERAEGWYEVVTNREPVWVPFEVERLLQSTYRRTDGAISEAVDSAAAIEAGRNFAQSAPPAMEGQRGDDVTFVTAARMVRELALSVPEAFDLLWEYWNPRCEPPWSWDELYAKVENANMYGTADMGRLDPSVLFRDVTIPPPPPSVFTQQDLDWGNALLPSNMPPRPWMIDRLLMLHEITLLLAPGSAGKSSTSLAIAAHLAVGKNFGPYEVKVKIKTVVYNGEDDVIEQSRRLYAVCQSYGLDYAEVSSRIMLLSADEIDMRLVSAQGRAAVPDETMISQLVDLASDPDVGLIIYDPLVDVHEVDEGDNPMMNMVMKTLRRINKQANVACLVLHHTSKAGSSRQEDRVGNMDISRGASGIVNKARIAYTLLNASQSDAEEYGMQDGERGSWVRLDDAKMNFALASGKANWFRKEGVKLPSGDVVGVMKYESLTPNTTNLRGRIAGIIIDTLRINEQASMQMLQAVAILKSQEPLLANKTDQQIKQNLEGMFATPIEMQGQTLHVKREEGKQGVLIVMT